MDLAPFAAALEASALGTWMRGGWSYALVNVAHLAGLALLVGPIVLLDLRLLGFGKGFAPEAVSAALTPFAVAGLLLSAASGIALFAADATALVGNRLMQFKLLALALAVANAALFRFAFARHLPHWDRRGRLSARASALLSILLWSAILVAGRLIAYV